VRVAGEEEDGVAIAHDWWTSGWNKFLPRQALWLHMVVATATVKDLDGSLDDLIDSFGRDAFDRDTGGLDGPVWWTFPDQDETDDEQLAMDRASQEVFEAVLERAARVPPRSVRELAMLMADFGVFEREFVGDVERWRSPEVLPLVAERLPVSEQFTAEEDRLRWRSLHEDSAQAIIRHLIDVLGEPDEVLTTLARLAADTGLDLGDLRFGIAALLDDGDFALLDGASGNDVDPETLEEVRSVVLRVDWERFGQERIGLRFADPGDRDDR
jgi:Family of unknown function (DUF6042)